MAKKSVAAFWLLALLVGVSSALADEAAAKAGEPPPSWHVVVSPSITLPAFDTTYVSRYSPPFQYVPYTSAAAQTMPLKAGTGPGVLVGLGLAPAAVRVDPSLFRAALALTVRF